MDSFIENEDLNRSIETRWDRIEKRHINSAIVYDRTDAAAEICKNLIQNKEFVTENQLKTLLGDKTTNHYLDPNLVMDLRHSRVSFFSLISWYFLSKQHCLRISHVLQS